MATNRAAMMMAKKRADKARNIARMKRDNDAKARFLKIQELKRQVK